jgi:predicted nuclease of predicted toxin-antitoxin system
VRCKIDENMPIDAAQLLRASGHECDTVYDEALSGARDERVVERCRVEQRALLTLDLDFADIRSYPPGEYHGIVVLRPSESDRTRVLRLLGRIVPLLDRESLSGALWIVDEHRVRIHRDDDLGTPEGSRARQPEG